MVNNMKNMKDSQISWVGDIPSNWSVIKFNKAVLRIATGLNPRDNFKLGEGNNYYVTIQNFKNGEILLDDKCDKVNDETLRIIDERSDLQVDDILFASISKNGQAYLIKEKPRNWNINESVFTLRPNRKLVFPKFLYITLISGYFYDNLIAGATGSTFSSIKIGMLKENKMILPPNTEQIKIAQYIEQKVSFINSIIEKTKASIEEYKKLKQSIITEAVTKGLNSNVKMKDSGIEWIGEIPEHWDKTYLTQILQQVKNKNMGMKEANLLSLSYGKIIRKDINTADGLLPENFEGYNIIAKDDIVLRLTDLQNDQRSLRVGLVEEDGIITSAYITLRAKTLLSSQFIYYFLHSFDVCKGFYGMGAGVRQGLTFEGIKYLNLYLPTFDEQLEIVKYIKSKADKIEKFIDKKEQLIKELESYKKSLIYEVVTGKKEIPTQEVGTFGL